MATQRKTLRDYLLNGGVSGRHFVCGHDIEDDRSCQVTYTPKDIKLSGLVGDRDVQVEMVFDGDKSRAKSQDRLDSHLEDPEATEREVSQSRREYRLLDELSQCID